MTTYNYLSEMQELCFRASQALTVLEDAGLKDFYSAAEQGFFSKMDGMPVPEAEKPINQSQVEQYLITKEFVETKEYEAAEKLREENEAVKEPCYQEKKEVC